ENQIASESIDLSGFHLCSRQSSSLLDEAQVCTPRTVPLAQLIVVELLVPFDSVLDHRPHTCTTVPLGAAWTSRHQIHSGEIRCSKWRSLHRLEGFLWFFQPEFHQAFVREL